ncbi:MAG: histidine phosphatase family protein, partial [Deltaproteobacteria bacterium]|nr:histidine phosphatase family protein [Deltaproteobacteria bacterium]
GRAQMEAMAGTIRSWRPEVVLCSPLVRAKDSAAILVGADGPKLIVVPDLAEIDLGDWEGLTVAEVQTRFPGEYERRGRDLAGYRPRGGESFEDLARRTVPVLESLPGKGPVLVVAHAGVNRVLFCHVLGLPLANLFRLGQDPGCLNVLQAGDKGWLAKVMNRDREGLLPSLPASGF